MRAEARRCIMRKVSFNLELRDCRSVKTSHECFHQILEHLRYAGNGGSVKSVISVFPQKGDGISAPVRVWNRQLVGYAAYQRQDGSVMGDPVNLSFTAMCVKLGWNPPTVKSDFDFLPLVISDDIVGHDRPRVFNIPADAIMEVPIHHPEHELFSSLNLRWYAMPAISNMGVDTGKSKTAEELLHEGRMHESMKKAVCKDAPGSRGRLLCSGFWGAARHINYLGEVLQGTALALPGFLATGSLAPFLYPVYYALLFVGRQQDDDGYLLRAKYINQIRPRHKIQQVVSVRRKIPKRRQGYRPP